MPQITEKPEIEYYEHINKKGKLVRDSQWLYETSLLPPKLRGVARSKTFMGVAKAMAEQWG